MKTIQELVPGWNDPKQAAKHRKDLLDYATQNGFKPEEIAQFSKTKESF